MLPACVKTEVWQLLIEDLARTLGVSIFCENAAYGKISFFQQLRNRTSDDPFSSLGGIHYARILVDRVSVIVGPFRTSEPHAFDEELSDARENLPHWQEPFEQLISITVQHAALAGKIDFQKTESLQRAKLLLEFTQSLSSTRGLTPALSHALQFLVHKFKLSNASIFVCGKHARYFDITETAKLVETRVISHITNTKSPYSISNLTKDFFLHDIKDLEKLNPALLAIPLISEREFIGSVILTSDQLPPLEQVSEVIFELQTVVKRLAAYEQAQTNAVTDSLTGLTNRADMHKLDLLIAQLGSRSQPIHFLMVDADNFKKFNDTYGHPEGDKLLLLIAELIKNTMPQDAFCYRYGGEEFLVVIPSILPVEAKELAEKLRLAIEQHCPLTVSIGLMSCMNSSISREKLIKEADQALYSAKHYGKNKVVARLMVDKNLGIIDG